MMPDPLEIRKAYASDPMLKAIFEYSSGRERNAVEWPVERAERAIAEMGEDVSRGAIVEAFRKLEDLGLGEFVVGRRTKPSRFVWRVPMIEAGKVAKGVSSALPIVDGIDEQSGEMVLLNPHASRDAIYHSFNLRPDFVVSFELPRDFSNREATRLTEFIKMLPFEHH